MPCKAPARSGILVLAEREQELRSFVADAVGSITGARHDGILVVARALDSLAMRVITSLALELAPRRIGAQIVLATSVRAAAGGPHAVAFPAEFIHEVRAVEDPRILGAHEQLVIGESAVWFGDAMRREADKRDAFACFRPDAASATVARHTFSRLWRAATFVSAGPVPAMIGIDDVPAEPCPAENRLDDPIRSLTAWEPSTTH